MIRSSAEIIEAAKNLSASSKTGKSRVAVAAAQDADVLGAVYEAYREGICDVILCGDSAKIKSIASSSNIPLDGMEIVDKSDPIEAVHSAAQLADAGKADVIMKGFVSSSGLLKGILDRRYNLRVSKTLSHVAVLTIPGRDKLLMVTDGGMMVKPSRNQKIDILKNAVLVGRALGIDPVRVALSAAAEVVTERLPQTVESDAVVNEIAGANIDGCQVAGPLGFDAAVSPDIAKRLKLDDGVAGQADVYLCGTVEEGNITSKSLICFGGAIFAGVIVGAKVPVSLVSRTDPILGKKTSVALACLVANYNRSIADGGQK